MYGNVGTCGKMLIGRQNRNLPRFVDLLLTWNLDSKKPRGEAGRRAL